MHNLILDSNSKVRNPKQASIVEIKNSAMIDMNHLMMIPKKRSRHNGRLSISFIFVSLFIISLCFTSVLSVAGYLFSDYIPRPDHNYSYGTSIIDHRDDTSSVETIMNKTPLKVTMSIPLAFLSYIVSFFGSFTSIQLLSQASITNVRLYRMGWLVLCALVFGGCGVWGMHFVGMLAFKIDAEVRYAIFPTILSYLVVVTFMAANLLYDDLVLLYRNEWDIKYWTSSYINIGNTFGKAPEGQDSEELFYEESPRLPSNISDTPDSGLQSLVARIHNRYNDVASPNFLNQSSYLVDNVEPRYFYYLPRALNGYRVDLSSRFFIKTIILFFACFGMHVIGISAMMNVKVTWNLPIALLCILIGAATSFFTNSAGSNIFTFKQQFTIASFISLGVCLMHYVGMFALTIYADDENPPYNGGMENLPVITLVTVVSMTTSFLSYVGLSQSIVNSRDKLAEMIMTKKKLWKVLAEKEAAERSNQIKTDFISIASHEIRTPLHAIAGYTELLESTFMNQEQNTYLDAIKNSIHTIQIITNNVLDFAKLERVNADKHVKLVEMNFRMVLTKIIRSCGYRDKKINLFFLVDNSIPEKIPIDETYFTRIIMNLVSNALKFTHDGFICILCKIERYVTSQRLVIKVRDTGIGISPQFFDVLFQPFRQEDTSLTRKYEGTGLGLAICKQLAEILNGEITVESKIDNGTEFTVSFPYNDMNFQRKNKKRLSPFIGRNSSNNNMSSRSSSSLMTSDMISDYSRHNNDEFYSRPGTRGFDGNESTVSRESMVEQAVGLGLFYVNNETRESSTFLFGNSNNTTSSNNRIHNISDDLNGIKLINEQFLSIAEKLLDPRYDNNENQNPFADGNSPTEYQSNKNSLILNNSLLNKHVKDLLLSLKPIKLYICSKNKPSRLFISSLLTIFPFFEVYYDDISMVNKCSFLLLDKAMIFEKDIQEIIENNPYITILFLHNELLSLKCIDDNDYAFPIQIVDINDPLETEDKSRILMENIENGRQHQSEKIQFGKILVFTQPINLEIMINRIVEIDLMKFKLESSSRKYEMNSDGEIDVNSKLRRLSDESSQSFHSDTLLMQDENKHDSEETKNGEEAYNNYNNNNYGKNTSRLAALIEISEKKATIEYEKDGHQLKTKKGLEPKIIFSSDDNDNDNIIDDSCIVSRSSYKNYINGLTKVRFSTSIEEKDKENNDMEEEEEDNEEDNEEVLLEENTDNDTDETLLLRTILLVEDNKINQRLGLQLLKKLGYATKLANNGKEAVEIVEEQKIDFILMDNQMPIMNGFEATQRIRENGFTGPIVALTANVSEESRNASNEVGMDKFLAKPLNMKELHECIEGFFDGSTNKTPSKPFQPSKPVQPSKPFQPSKPVQPSSQTTGTTAPTGN